MKLVQKGNRQLRIEDSRLQEFLAKGYTEIVRQSAESKPAAPPRRKKGGAV